MTTWGRGRARKMGSEAGGPRRRFADAKITRGGVDFEINAITGLVTCTVCKRFGTSSGPLMPLFMARHVEQHGQGLMPAGASVEKVELLVEELLQLGGDELDVIGEVIAGLVAGRKVYGELKVDTDRRDFAAEVRDEQRDALVYQAAEVIRARRRRRAGIGPRTGGTDG